VANEHLAQAGLGVRIDHRSYREQGIELSPGRKLGVGRERQEDERLPSFLADRIEEQRRIAGANGVQILADPTLALKAMTHSQATFSHHDLARFRQALAMYEQGHSGRSANQSSIAAFSAGKLWRRWRSSHCLVEARVQFQTTLAYSATPDLGKSQSWTEDLGKAPEEFVS
jgi:MobA/MobL family